MPGHLARHPYSCSCTCSTSLLIHTCPCHILCQAHLELPTSEAAVDATERDRRPFGTSSAGKLSSDRWRVLCPASIIPDRLACSIIIVKQKLMLLVKQSHEHTRTLPELTMPIPCRKAGLNHLAWVQPDGLHFECGTTMIMFDRPCMEAAAAVCGDSDECLEWLGYCLPQDVKTLTRPQQDAHVLCDSCCGQHHYIIIELEVQRQAHAICLPIA